MTVRELTNRADLGLSGSQFWIWFGTADLRGDSLIVSSDEDKDAIERLFGDRLRVVIPHLSILIEPLEARIKGATNKMSPLKASAPRELRDLFGKREKL